MIRMCQVKAFFTTSCLVARKEVSLSYHYWLVFQGDFVEEEEEEEVCKETDISDSLAIYVLIGWPITHMAPER